MTIAHRRRGQDHAHRGDATASSSRRSTFFADWRDEIVAEHIGWMVPDHYDPAIRLPQAQHSLLADRGRRPEDPDRYLRRQSQVRASTARSGIMLNTPYLERLAAAGAKPEEHRHGDVHAPARRPCRLEYAARQRPLGADVPECAVRFQQDRLRAFPQALDRDPEKGPAIGGAFRDSVLPDRRGRARQMVDGTRGDRGASLARRPRPGHSPGHVLDQPRLAGHGKRCSAATSSTTSIQLYHPTWNSFACTDQPTARAIAAHDARKMRWLGRAAACRSISARRIFCHIDPHRDAFPPRFV